jgi:hypothetical protein
MRLSSCVRRANDGACTDAGVSDLSAGTPGWEAKMKKSISLLLAVLLLLLIGVGCSSPSPSSDNDENKAGTSRDCSKLEPENPYSPDSGHHAGFEWAERHEHSIVFSRIND